MTFLEQNRLVGFREEDWRIKQRWSERFTVGDGSNHSLKTKLIKDCVVILLLELPT